MAPRTFARTIAAFTLFASALPVSATTITSALHPLTVHYDDDGNAAYASALLAAADAAWTFQVDGLGFVPPPPDAGLNGDDNYDIFVGANPYGAGCHREQSAASRPYGFASTIVMDPSQIPDWALGLVVSHEFHHAIQMGIRPVNDGVMEGGAVYVSGMHRRGEAYQLSYYLGINEFQSYPERALDWQAGLGNFYPYGVALFFIFLDQVYGDPDTLAVYKAMWDQLGASDSVSYDAALGALVDFDEAFLKFERWRYFVGSEDDSHHLSDLDNWTRARADEALVSVPLVADLAAEALPQSGLLVDNAPMPYAAQYVRLALAGLATSDEIELWFVGDSNTRWRIEVMRLKAGAAPDETDHQVDASGESVLRVKVEDSESVVFAFVNLGNGSYRPGGSGWMQSQLQYDLSVAPPAAPPEPAAEADHASGCSALGSADPTSLGLVALWAICGVGSRRRRAPLL